MHESAALTLPGSSRSSYPRRLFLEPHDEERLASLLPRFSEYAPGRRGDPPALERAWGDWFGCGRYAVLLADVGSHVIEHVAPSFYAALERVVAGPRLDWDRDLIQRPRPPDSARV